MASLPTVGGSNNTWGTELNAYLTIGHNADGTLKDTYRSSHLVRYVDYVSGSDSNDGQTPYRAHKTIAAAYADLTTDAAASWTAVSGRLGVGTLVLLPGDHQVGTGVVFDYRYPVCIKGTRSGPREHATQNSASRIVSTSGAATSFMKIDGGSGNIARGFSFDDIAFMMDHTVNTALTSIIYAKRVGYLTVENCAFTNADGSTNVSIPAILHEDATDSSGEGGWARIRDNVVSRMALYKCTTGSTGGNFNRGRIADNVVFYGGTLPMIHLDANTNGYLVDGNNLEGTAVAIEIGPLGTFTQNLFLNNSGEDGSSGTPPNPFYSLSGSVSQQIIIGGICSSTGASGAGTWVSFGADAYRNIVIGVLDFTATTTSHKRYVSETSHADKNLLVPTNAATPTYTVNSATTQRTVNVKTGAVALTERKFLDTTAQTATTTVVPGTTLAAGTLGVLVSAMNANKTMASVTDSSGNTWVVDATHNDGTRALSIASCQVATQVTSGGSITITWSNATSSGTAGIWLVEATNMTSASAFDKTANGSGTGTSLATSATAALAQEYELAVAIFRSTNGSPTPALGSGWSSSGNLVTSDNGILFEYKIVDAATGITGTATWPGSGTWVALTGTYKALAPSGAIFNVSQALGTLIADLQARGIVK